METTIVGRVALRSPSDATDGSAGLRVSVDSATFGVTYAWLATDCVAARGRLVCESPSRAARLALTPVHGAPRLSRLAVRLPALGARAVPKGPVTVTLSGGKTGRDRVARIARCATSGRALVCRQRSGTIGRRA
jgi:hypothetical protein